MDNKRQIPNEQVVFNLQNNSLSWFKLNEQLDIQKQEIDAKIAELTNTIRESFRFIKGDVILIPSSSIRQFDKFIELMYYPGAGVIKFKIGFYCNYNGREWSSYATSGYTYEELMKIQLLISTN